jgi:hypothetical protein
MRGSKPEDVQHESMHDDDGRSSRDEEPETLTLPPALIGFLLLVAVTLACVFYVAAQVIHTP